ncbi:MAG TPA: FtsX-like permease family protein, partial [Pirellulales bacterium]|nr:FtsX-like permease family protein [Pirellulales bacterium]
NLPYSYYQEFLKDERHRGRFSSSVDVAVPLCLGDSYEQFRVVGTTPAMFEVWEPYQRYEFAQGRNFKHENFFEGVIGSIVAHSTGLKVGDTFQPTHGIENEDGHKHDAFTVVGVLKPTGTPNDRAIFINMEGFYLLRGHAKEEEADGHEPGDSDHDHAEAAPGLEPGDSDHKPATKAGATGDGDEHADHDHEHADGDHEHADDGHAEVAPGLVPGGSDHEPATRAGATGDGDEHADHDHDAGHEHKHSHTPLPESQREVTAILVRTTGPIVAMGLRKTINKGNEAQAVLPGAEIQQLLESIVGNLRLLLLALAVLTVIVAGIGIMVSIYNSMSDRRRDIAVMRALGARRATVLNVILLESMLLSLGGGLGGWLLAHVLIAAASPWVLAYTGFAMGAVSFTWQELVLLPALMVLATLVGYLPALDGYRTDVAKALTASP